MTAIVKIGSKDLTDILMCAKLCMDEITFYFGDDNVQAMDVDPTHVQMFHGIAQCECSEKCVISVPVEKMVKALAAAGNGEIELEIDESFVKIHGEHTRVKVPLIDRDSRFKWPEKLNTPIATCEIEPSILAPALSYGTFTAASRVQIAIGDTKMKMNIMSDTADDIEIESSHTAVGDSTSCLSISYLDTLIKHVKSVPTIQVGAFGDDHPVQISWATDKARFKVLIAPWIEK